MKRAIRILVFTLLVAAAFGQSSKNEKTDAEIRQEIIKQSIGSFKGSCPCPYNVHPDGKMCGRFNGMTDVVEGNDGEPTRQLRDENNRQHRQADRADNRSARRMRKFEQQECALRRET
jgi:hypothetical protein